MIGPTGLDGLFAAAVVAWALTIQLRMKIQEWARNLFSSALVVALA